MGYGVLEILGPNQTNWAEEEFGVLEEEFGSKLLEFEDPLQILYKEKKQISLFIQQPWIMRFELANFDKII